MKVESSFINTWNIGIELLPVIRIMHCYEKSVEITMGWLYWELEVDIYWGDPDGV